MISDNALTHRSTYRAANSVIVMAFLLLTGCTTHVAVDGAFPDPLLTPIPVAVAVVYGNGFAEYSYEQQEKGGSKYILDLGEAQAELFNQVLSSTFNKVTYSKQITAAPQQEGDGAVPVDLWLSVTVEDVQFSRPDDSMGNVYEVWLKYYFRFMNPAGEAVAQWSAPGYGKAGDSRFKTHGAGIKQAAHRALRDAGAHFVLKLRRNVELDEYLHNRNIDMGAW